MDRKQNRVRKTEQVALSAILGAFVVLGALFSIVVPIFEASDEVWHYPMVAHLARTWSLPVQPLDPGASSGPWRQEASQPPLYYALGAMLTAWIDTSDLDQTRHLNPHVAAGEITPDGSNPNLVVHNPALERFPWKGTVLSIHLVRLFSVALGAWAVYLTWALVHELYPDPSWLALAAAAVHAFTPMYLFISSSVNNDNLIVPLCSWALWLMVRRIRMQDAGCRKQETTDQRISGSTDRRIQSPNSKIQNSLLLGVVIGLGLLTKASAIGLLPLAAAVVAWEMWRGIESRMADSKSARRVSESASRRIMNHESRTADSISKIQNPKSKITFHVSRFTFHALRLVPFALRDLFFMLVPAFAISGWWFYRNFQLYGDWLGLNAFYAVLGTRDVAADLAQLWAERFAFAAGYWGNFGGLNVPMAGWIYTVLNTLAVIAALGLSVRFVLWAVRCKMRDTGRENHESGLMNQALGNRHAKNGEVVRVDASRFTFHVSRFMSCALRHLWPFCWDSLTAARALAWAWPAAVFVSWIRWAAITWSSQGRLIFSAIPMWSLALVMGLRVTNDESRIANRDSANQRVGKPAGQRIPDYGLRISRFTPYLLPGFLFILCLVALPVWIVPAYTPPAAVDFPLTRSLSGVDFGNVLRLTGFEIDRQDTSPGSTVSLTLQWKALAPTATDHSLFLHVLGEGGRIIAQRDTFPGRGLVSTVWLEPGQTWDEHYEIAIPALAYSPDALTFSVGIYETATGARLPAQIAMPSEVTHDNAPFASEPGSDSVMFGAVRLAATPLPDVYFGKGMVLTGYDLSALAVAPGATLTVTFDWRCAMPVEGDYTISVQLIDDQWRKAAQSDAWPLDGAAPTSSWQRGQTLTETRTLTIAADVVPGVYDLRLAVYRAGANGELEHLPIVWEPGQMPAKSVMLTRVRVR
ncbi:MAG: glycosyltransferase family 39 protein [Anaerolineae bacterium]|nr:glycosyltransferase family 39 protein [Anaerolineae bacterium]